MACPACGADVTTSAKFCSECGARLTASASAPAAAERKVVSALFCDLVGSTALGERVDAEHVDALLRRYHALARTRIEEHGGAVQKFIGDAVVALFGFPLAHEDDAARAVRAALAIVGDMRASDLGLEVRVAVNTGEAFVRPDVDPASGEGFVTGDVMNTAARMQSAARPMSVVIGERTVAVTDGGFLVEPLEPVRAHGKAEPVALFRVAGEAAAREGERTATRFVGREHELGVLRAALSRLREGGGGAVLVEGAPGIGKSRLVREVRVGAGALTWLRGRSLETRDASGYRPFGEQIRGWVGSERLTWERLVEQASRLGLAEDDVPFLAMLAGIEAPAPVAERLGALDGEVSRPAIYRAVYRWLDALAGAAPLALEFEDWHWADGASVQLAAHVLPLAGQRPLLFVHAARPGSEPAAELRAAAQASGPAGALAEVALGPLSDAEAEALLAAVAQGRPLSAERLHAAAARGEGNPYFLQELSRFIEERERGGDVLPDSVRAVVTARIDRLDPELRALMRSAAVVGRSFDVELLAAISGGEEVEESLARLAATQLVEPAGAGAYRFAHALTRESVYEGIPLADRHELHLRIAAALEARGDAAATLPAVAYHLAAAEDWEAASAKLLAAGEQAARLASDDEALEMFREAIRAHARLPEGRWSALDRSRLDRQIAEALTRLGRHAEAAVHVTAALGRMGVRVPEGEAAVRRASAAQLARRIRRPPELPGRDAAPSAEEVEIAHELELLGFIAFYSDLERFALASLMLTNRAARAGSLDGVALGVYRCAIAFSGLGWQKLAYAYRARALEAAERELDPVDRARVVQGAGLADFCFGSAEDCRAIFGRGMSLADEAGDLRSWGAAAVLGAWAEIEAGELQAAGALIDRMLQAGLEGGDLQVHNYGVGLGSFVRLAAGEPAGAQEAAERAHRYAMTIPDFTVGAACNGSLALAQVRLGDAKAAAATIERGRREAKAAGMRGWALSYIVLAEAELALLELALRGRRDAGAASAAVKTAVKHGELARWFEPRAHVLDATLAWLTGKERAALSALERAGRAAEQSGYGGGLRDGADRLAALCSVAGVEPPPRLV